MNFLFWLLFILNLLLAVFMIWGIGFRASFGASTDLNSLLLIVMLLIQLAGLFVRYGIKNPNWSLFVVAIPLIILFIGYIFDDKSRVGE